MSRMEFFDRDGAPIDMLVWAAMQTDEKIKRVASDVIQGDGVTVAVSTVWLGLDHSFDGRRLIFETMIFGGTHDQWQRRYSSEAQAFAGHDQALAMVAHEMSLR